MQTTFDGRTGPERFIICHLNKGLIRFSHCFSKLFRLHFAMCVIESSFNLPNLSWSENCSVCNIKAFFVPNFTSSNWGENLDITKFVFLKLWKSLNYEVLCSKLRQLNRMIVCVYGEPLNLTSKENQIHCKWASILCLLKLISCKSLVDISNTFSTRLFDLKLTSFIQWLTFEFNVPIRHTRCLLCLLFQSRDVIEIFQLRNFIHYNRSHEATIFQQKCAL